MRRTRFMTLLFLVLSGAFFLIPEFRQGLHGPLVSLVSRAELWGWLESAGKLSSEKLAELRRAGERDARALAFVALHLPWENWQESARLADQAVTLDPQLTWIYGNLASRQRSAWQMPEVAGAAEEWIMRLQKWDSGNAVPYLLQAEWIYETQGLRRYRGAMKKELEALAKEAAWRAAMEKAFAAPRYDSYGLRRFELERTVLRQHGLARPSVVLWSLANYPLPHLSNITHYSNLLVLKLGDEAAQARRFPEALDHYWRVAHFGERMQVQGRSLVEKLTARDLQVLGYERLLPLLRQMGRTDEATTVAYALEQLHAQMAIASGKDPLAQSSNYNWAVLMVQMLAVLVAVFGTFTALCTGYVNAKRWIRPEKKGKLYQFLTVAENYAPILLFFACLGFYVHYYPYAQNFEHYMTARGEIHDFEPLWFNAFPTFGGPPGRLALPIRNPFLPYVWYALGGVGVVAGLGALLRRRA